ncbi:MAG: MobC family plasmid mobilization relaxosome protein [Hyphomonadaceae bacterium]|nr:MobC family plasmid mobilization relaxosome protein [Hyphomonadaceae bacterium]
MIQAHSSARADAVKAFAPQKTTSRAAPFSLRLSAEERRRLEARADGLPLGAFIKGRLFDEKARGAARKPTKAIKNPEALARALSLLGQSRIASNLNQLAKAANLGTLPLTPDVIDDVEEACRMVAEIRRLLIEALGLKAGGRS